MKKHLKDLGSIGSIVTVLMVVGCVGGGLKLRELNDNPGKYNEREVTVKGKVVKTFGLPVIGQGVAQIDDGTGTVWVKPYNRVPFEGEKVKIRGTVKVGLTVATKSFGVIVVEKAKE